VDDETAGAATVLVIEDDPTLAEFFEVVLHGEGLSPVVSSTGSDAVRLATRHQTKLVVLDLMLPGLYGTAVADALKAKWPKLPIIVVSAQGAMTVAQDAWRARAFAYFTKPFEMTDFIAAVRNALSSAP
jgi:DNA-binding response OmpR family regulator